MEPAFSRAPRNACDPFRVSASGGSLSGGVAPGYSIDPLRGSNLGVIGVKMSHYQAPGRV